MKEKWPFIKQKETLAGISPMVTVPVKQRSNKMGTSGTPKAPHYPFRFAYNRY